MNMPHSTGWSFFNRTFFLSLPGRRLVAGFLLLYGLFLFLYALQTRAFRPAPPQAAETTLYETLETPDDIPTEAP